MKFSSCSYGNDYDYGYNYDYDYGYNYDYDYGYEYTTNISIKLWVKAHKN
jgi:hypothetical protein